MSEMRWTNWQGNEVSREVNETIDLRQFEETAGYALLVLAANPHLSRFELWMWLKRHGVGRSESWITRRRWLFKKPSEKNNAPGVKPDADGHGKRALEIMSANPRSSLRDLTKLLAARGIGRSREWVRQSRCLTTNRS
jgi:hypothetical protein